MAVEGRGHVIAEEAELALEGGEDRLVVGITRRGGGAEGDDDLVDEPCDGEAAGAGARRRGREGGRVGEGAANEEDAGEEAVEGAPAVERGGEVGEDEEVGSAVAEEGGRVGFDDGPLERRGTGGAAGLDGGAEAVVAIVVGGGWTGRRGEAGREERGGGGGAGFEAGHGRWGAAARARCDRPRGDRRRLWCPRLHWPGRTSGLVKSARSLPRWLRCRGPGVPPARQVARLRAAWGVPRPRRNASRRWGPGTKKAARGGVLVAAFGSGPCLH